LKGDTKFSFGFFITLIGLIVGVPPTIGLILSLASTGTYDTTYRTTYIIAILLLIGAAFGIYLMRTAD